MDKLFEPNYKDLKFKISINVHDNCNTFTISNNNNYKFTYQEVIGVLEIIKADMMRRQSEANKKTFKKLQAEQKKQKKLKE